MTKPYRLIVKRHGLILDERTIESPARLVAGRDPGSDLVLDDASTSKQAAVFELRSGALWVVDPGSLDGLRVNGEAVAEGRLQRGDEVTAGPFIIEVDGGPERQFTAEDDSAGDTGVHPHRAHTGEHIRSSGKAVGVVRNPEHEPRPDATKVAALVWPGHRVELAVGNHRVGRDSDSDVVVHGEAVSKGHAVLYVRADGVEVEDSGSTNGTRLNGRRIQRAVVAAGDRLGFGDVECRLEALVDSLRRPAGATAETLVVGPESSDAGGATGAAMNLITGDMLEAQRRSLPVEAPAPAAGRGRRLRRIVLSMMLLVVVALLIMVLSWPSAPPLEPVVAPAPATAPAPAPEPQVTAAELYLQGRDLLREDRFEQAAQTWERALELADAPPGLVHEYARLLFRIGYIYEGDGRYDTARQVWERMVAALPDYPEQEYVIKARVHLRRLQEAR